MVEADSTARDAKKMRDVIRYIDTNQVEKIFKIVGADDGIPIDAPIAQIGGMTSLMHSAAVSGNTVMNAIIQKGPAIGKRDTTGRNALHYSCRAGNQKTTKILLEAMSEEEKEQATNGGITPLMSAVQSGDVNVVQMLLAAGCDPTKQDLLGQSVLFYARAFKDVNGQNMSEIDKSC